MPKYKVGRSLGDRCNVRCGTGSVEPKQPYNITQKSQFTL